MSVTGRSGYSGTGNSGRLVGDGGSREPKGEVGDPDTRCRSICANRSVSSRRWGLLGGLKRVGRRQPLGMLAEAVLAAAGVAHGRRTRMHSSTALARPSRPLILCTGRLDNTTSKSASLTATLSCRPCATRCDRIPGGIAPSDVRSETPCLPRAPTWPPAHPFGPHGRVPLRRAALPGRGGGPIRTRAGPAAGGVPQPDRRRQSYAAPGRRARHRRRSRRRTTR